MQDAPEHMATDMLQLRAATADEAPEILALMMRVLRASLRAEPPAVREEMAHNVRRNLEIWLAAPQDSVHLVALEGGRIVGVVLVKECWNLCSLFVETRCQGRGLGRRLVEAAVAACRGCSPRQALCLNAAPTAIAFYQRLGFVDRATAQALPTGFKALQRPL